jgi:hypothetical protein
MLRLLAIASATLLLVACSSSSPSQVPSPIPTAAAPAIPPEAGPAVDAAKQAAATHLGATPDQLQVTQVQSQQWPDASLGCPQAGQLYSQIVTPGFLVLIASGGRQLEYHTDTRGRAVLCHES